MNPVPASTTANSGAGVSPSQPLTNSDTAGSSPPATETDTCWHRIGIYGDGSCDELPKFIHCRNCPVYSQAAHQLLDRPLPELYRQEWTAHFAQDEEKAPPAKISAVVFRLNAEWLALPTHAFQEIAERRGIHSLPHRRQGIVVGLVNIRGELLICVSLARLLGIESLSPGATRKKYDRLLVASWDASRLAFPADEVHGIHRFQGGELREPPATVSKAALSYTQGIFLWQKKVVGLLEPTLLFAALNRSLT